MDEQGKDLSDNVNEQPNDIANQIIPLTSQDQKDILAEPGIYSNKSFVSIAVNMAKITFAEYDMGVNAIRCSVVMDIQSAINLANTIVFMVQKNQEEMVSQMQNAQEVIRNRGNGVN